jgi:RNA polymerase sigma factor (sigma-70 family)
MTPHPDQKYITALLNNDTVLLKQLYANYAVKISAMIQKNSGTEVDAADIFQEALLAIYQRAKRENFILTCPLDAYLYMICKNRWINELNRRSGRTVTFMDTEGYNHGEDSFKEAEIVHNQFERRNLLLQMVKELSDGCRQVLELSWSGLSMNDVAKKLQNTYGYVRKKKSECMAKLIALVKASPRFANLQW